MNRDARPWGWLPNQRLLAVGPLLAVLATLAGVQPTTTRRHAPLTASAPTSGVTLSLSDARTGYIAASLTGPDDAVVAVKEIRGGHDQTVAQATLGPNGTAKLPRLAHWECDPRSREFVAELDGAVSEQSHTAAIRTPSCKARLQSKRGRNATTAKGISLKVSDRWHLGGVRFSYCVTAPIGHRRCRAARLPTGVSSKRLTIAAPRPGGWRVTFRSGYRKPTKRTIWVAYPHHARIRLLAAGDSEMVDVDTYIDQTAAPYNVTGSGDSKSDSGLENEWFFNWYSEARLDVARYRPDVTVIFMGANAGFAIQSGKTLVQCCGDRWSALYAKAVEKLSRTFLRGDRGLVFWTTLPTPSSGGFQEIFDGVNRAEREAQQAMPGRIGIINANGFFTPGNVYRNTMTWGGQTFTIHQSDGLHLSTPSDWAYTHLVVDDLLKDRVLRHR